MILINNQWEQVKDLSDIIRIVKENISNEFATEAERIYEETLYELQTELNDLEYEILDYNDIHDRLDYLNEQLNLLEEYIDKNKDGTDYMNGMEKAYDMIER